MNQRRHKTRNQILGPRALAVVSCALALLAAQPNVNAANRMAPASVKVTGSVIMAETPVTVAPNRTTRRETATVRSDRFFGSAQRLHILATVEMLQRLLAFELRTVERPIYSAFIYEPITLCIFELPIAPPHRDLAVIEPILLPYERQFAISHCLLAPPVA